MKTENNYEIVGGFAELLLILFIGLKLIGVINWSWVLVLSPFWIMVIVSLVIVIFNIIGIKRSRKR